MQATLSRELIHRRLIGRLLPRVQAVDIWDGPGDGRPCDGCALPVTTLQHAIEAVASRWLSMYCHAQCFDIWDSERLLLSVGTSSPGDSGMSPRLSPVEGSRPPLHAPDHGVENNRGRDLLVKGDRLGRRTLELTERSRIAVSRSERLMAESDRRTTR